MARYLVVASVEPGYKPVYAIVDQNVLEFVKRRDGKLRRFRDRTKALSECQKLNDKN